MRIDFFLPSRSVLILDTSAFDRGLGGVQESRGVIRRDLPEREQGGDHGDLEGEPGGEPEVRQNEGMQI